MNRFFVYLDRINFLNFSAWDFIYRSALKEYGRFFFLRVLLPHPIKAFRGLLFYRKFCKKNKDIDAWSYRFLFTSEEDVWLKKLTEQDSGPLVGLGFCLKPHMPGRKDLSCPSGRANHDCLFCETGQTRAVCVECDIRRMATKSLERGFPVYIMTSAQDIARDILVPQVKSGEFPLSILLLCPYSVRVILLPLFICGMSSFLVAYGSGFCRDYEEWRKADLGEKEERTTLSQETQTKLEDFIERFPLNHEPARFFSKEGNVFFPRHLG